MIKITRSEDLAAEILQDTFLRIWNSRGNIDPSLCFRSYLFKIASNLVYDFFRRASLDVKIREALIEKETGMAVGAPEDLFIKENIELLKNTIRQLPPRRQEIFQLIKLEERSYAEVSSLLNVSASTINDHIVKAMKFLREKMFKYNIAEMYIFTLLLCY